MISNDLKNTITSNSKKKKIIATFTVKGVVGAVAIEKSD